MTCYRTNRALSFDHSSHSTPAKAGLLEQARKIKSFEMHDSNSDIRIALQAIDKLASTQESYR